MDDIQLCKDIMSLKQELRQIVVVPGTVQTQRHIHLPRSVKIEKNSCEHIRISLRIDRRNAESFRCSPEYHILSRCHGDLYIGSVIILNYAALITSLREVGEIVNTRRHTCIIALNLIWGEGSTMNFSKHSFLFCSCVAICLWGKNSILVPHSCFEMHLKCSKNVAHTQISAFIQVTWQQWVYLACVRAYEQEGLVSCSRIHGNNTRGPVDHSFF